jgi:1,4-dihydroxy-2-naphthoyl-CoA hydrolase
VSAERVASLNDFIRDKHPGMVGIEVLSCAADEVLGRLDVTEPLIAGTGFLWAPVVVTLADWLCACGTAENKPEDAGFTTVELKANFLRSVPAGGAIRGRAVPAHVGRTTQVWDVEVTEESSGRPIALFRCTQMILSPR